MSGQAPGQATCRVAFVPRDADLAISGHVCTCDQQHGAPSHHCPTCDVWWTLASESAAAETAKTAGQLAYEHRISVEKRRFVTRRFIAWDRLSPAERADEEAAATAAQKPLRDALASALGETRLYREAVSEIRRACDGVTPGGSYSSFARRILGIINRLEGK